MWSALWSFHLICSVDHWRNLNIILLRHLNRIQYRRCLVEGKLPSCETIHWRDTQVFDCYHSAPTATALCSVASNSPSWCKLIFHTPKFCFPCPFPCSYCVAFWCWSMCCCSWVRQQFETFEVRNNQTSSTERHVSKSGDWLSVLMLKIQVMFLRTRPVSWVHQKIILSLQLKIPSNWQSYQIGSGPCLQWAVARLASRGRWMQYLVVSPHSLRAAAILSL